LRLRARRRRNGDLHRDEAERQREKAIAHPIRT
jgi:hypothetical protein